MRVVPVKTFIGLCLALLAFACAGAPTKTAWGKGMKVHIVHGYAASPADHWFPWLKRELERQGAEVSIVELPEPQAPDPAAWQQALAAQIGNADENTWFVAHSLGGIALLRHLEGLPEQARIGGYVLVSGFNEALSPLRQLDGFLKPDLDYPRLSAIAGQRVVIAARDDDIVPFALSRSLAESLDARFVAVERGGHFLARDGFGEFPVLLEQLEAATGRR